MMLYPAATQSEDEEIEAPIYRANKSSPLRVKKQQPRSTLYPQVIVE